MTERVFPLPDVGEGLIEADIVTWKVAVGDVVTLNQPLCDVETAKAVVELPSPYAGRVSALHGNAGDTVAVGEPLVTFDADPAAASTTTVETHSTGEVPLENRREAVLIGYGVTNDDEVVVRTGRRGRTTGAVTPANAVRTTPPVRLVAKQLGVDLAGVTGTGRDGLITREDVERAVSPTRPTRTTAPVSGPGTTSRFVGRDLAPWDDGPLEERIAVKGLLKSMADAMVQSVREAPQAAAWVRCDATKTVELLAGLKQHPNLAGVRLSPLTIVALALCDAARHYPGINSSFDDAAGEVVVRRRVNLGIAADTPRGLVVPNIKGADRLDLVAMAQALADLVDQARAGVTTPASMQNTTLTITNVGPFGIDGAVPLLPPGTGAILCVGQVAKAPWVVDDQVVVRHVVELSMAFDHRQIDGALASAVLAHVAAFVRDPATALLAG